jgi:hypothetical protein
MPEETQLDPRQIKSTKDGFVDLYEQLEFGRFNSVKSGAAPTLYQEIVAEDHQSRFTLPQGIFTVGDHSLQVFVNGQLMREGADNDYIEIDNKTVQFLFGLVANDIVVFRVNGGTSGPSLHESYRSAAGQTVFNLATGYAAGNHSLVVFVNGAYQTVDEDYLETDANTVTFTDSLEENDLVTFRVEGLPTINSTYKNIHIDRLYDSNNRLIREEAIGDEHILKEYQYDADGRPEKMIITDSGYTIVKTYTWAGRLCTGITESVKEGTS